MRPKRCWRALTLPVHDRALLASGLLASLDSETLGESEVEAPWSAETERRPAQLVAGHVEIISWDNVVKHIDELRS